MMVNLPCLQGSCPNFLRPTCSYTECQLSFHTGSMPYGGYSCRLQLLFVFDYFLTCPVSHSTHSVDAPLCLPLVGLLLTEFPFPVSLGFLSRTLLSTRCFWNSTGFWISSFLIDYATAVCTFSGYRISFSSFSGSYPSPVFSIV